MCGIIGYIGKENCVPILINALEALEYRGYDSAGISYKYDNKVIIKKEEGRIENLKCMLDDTVSHIGIGHTRWATHGKPSKTNSHPHRVGSITLVHNGIIENYNELKQDLDYEFKSETDSEVVAALIDKLYKEYNDMLKVLNELKKYLVGSYALGIMVDGIDKIYTIRKDSPLIIGISDTGNFIASDMPAIINKTKKYYSLKNNEYAQIDTDSITIYNDNKKVVRDYEVFDYDITSSLKNGYDHFMLKEIYEQPKVIKDTIIEYASSIDELKKNMAGLEKYTGIDIIGCGSAYHVGMAGSYLLTKYGKLNVKVDIASEYRYKEHIYQGDHLIILISQSGETADTLAVLRSAKEKGIDTLAIVNVHGSTIAREADRVLYTKCGPEIAVATTKAYTSQLCVLNLIALYLGIVNNLVDDKKLHSLYDIDKYIYKVLSNENKIKNVAKSLSNNEDIYFIGRQIDYSLCLEASLKLKEISYIHSEAYAAGELKHGSISLIEKDTPVISLISDDATKLKTISNIKEVCARGARSIIITNDEYLDKNIYNDLILVPKTDELIQGILLIITAQLLAYYVAVYRKCDIDKPRNLAKSVTVE